MMTGFAIPDSPGLRRCSANQKCRSKSDFTISGLNKDRPLALVAFDFTFLEDGKVTNSGLEHWTIARIDGEWKILAVVWTSRED